jgi:hypothetical protein
VAITRTPMGILDTNHSSIIEIEGETRAKH